MEIVEQLAILNKMFDSQDWFAKTGLDQYGRPVVYVHRSSLEIERSIPRQIDGRQVLVHFMSSATVSKDKFVEEIRLASVAPLTVVQELVYEEPEPVLDLDILIMELDRLEKVCGKNILQDVFYEAHDGKNAVTNLSSSYPEIREDVDALYDEYGFDIIFDQLDV
jgi:hypothetical protein